MLRQTAALKILRKRHEDTRDGECFQYSQVDDVKLSRNQTRTNFRSFPKFCNTTVL